MKNKYFNIAILSVFLILIGNFIIVKWFFPDMKDSGAFGDMFGGVAALFSGLAFVGLIYTISLQREDLKIQKDELKLTREELAKTAEAQQKSGEALREQIKTMEKTAELNGLNSILQYLRSELVASTTGVSGHDANRRDWSRREAKRIREKIEKRIGISKG